MKLEKFTKNKKQKRIVIGSIVGILLLIGGITLYRTFALYKVEKSFDVLNGTIPNFRSDVTLALTVDGKSTEEIPTEDNNYAIQVDCDKGKGTWNRESWGIEIKNIEKNKVKCNIEFTTLKANESIFNFDYKGKEDAISLPSGKYKLEVWGAQGGAQNEQTKLLGGLGGYSKGEITLTASDTLYINVGGQGSIQKENNKDILGGYNGGGTGNAIAQIGFGGGGATHIAKVSGLLSDLEDHKEDDVILIVAGGGGGNGGTFSYGADVYGGSGGGYTGRDGYNNNSQNHTSYTGIGGTQEVGGYEIHKKSENAIGKFGTGGNYYYMEGDKCGIGTDIGGCGGAGGGGGYYGGGGSSRGHAGAGGGSGYIGNTLLTNKGMWCYDCGTSIDSSTKTTSTTNVSEEPISEYAKRGNGYARITYLGAS